MGAKEEQGKRRGQGKGKARLKVHKQRVGCFATARDLEPEAEGYATDGSQGDD